jgi:hypothetical protein
MAQSSSTLIGAGALLAILGVAGLLIPVFTTERPTEVAKLGPLTVQAEERTAHTIPPLVAGTALVLGVLLLGGGLYRSSRAS